jgi:dsDNA-specific endonuclease/ATPase MutS2
VQRKIVHKILSKNMLIDNFSQALPEAGGWGATIAILKAKEDK